MSGWAGEQGRTEPSGGVNDASQPAASSASGQHGQTASSHPSRASSPRPQRYQQAPVYGFDLPPLPQATGSRVTLQPPSTTRLAGVSSILNPSSSEEVIQSRRRKASELESPRAFAPSLPPLAMGIQAPISVSGRPGASPVSVYGGSTEPQGRRILTPRSPSLHRAASLGQLQPSSATISAQQMPFPGSPRLRVYAIEPGTLGAPPLPTPSAAMRPGYGFPAPTPPSAVAPRASPGATRGTGASSGSDSPTSSYSDYSRASPSAQYGSVSGGPPFPTYHEGSFGGAASAPPGAFGSERQRAVGIPISSSGGQNTYQMMTLETTSGTVQLPVDVQAASRVADEKRRRNAGASARFRQRRKEKEKEASTTIGKLEQRLKDLGEEVDFYRREREYLGGVLLQTPGGDRHFPRPASPRRRRRSSSAMQGRVGSGGSRYEEGVQRSPEQGRNVRRRTSTISLPPPPSLLPHAALGGPGAPYQSAYGQQSFGAPLAPHAAPQLPRTSGPLPSPLQREALLQTTTLPPMQAPPPGPPQLMQATPQTGPWNPYTARPRTPGQQPPRDTR